MLSASNEAAKRHNTTCYGEYAADLLTIGRVGIFTPMSDTATAVRQQLLAMISAMNSNTTQKQTNDCALMHELVYMHLPVVAALDYYTARNVCQRIVIVAV
jgi:hypothetical protein